MLNCNIRDIKNGGKHSTVREIVKNGMLSADIGAGAGIDTKKENNLLSLLTNFSIKGELGGAIGGKRESIVKNVISNTILTDYLKASARDKKIHKFVNGNVIPAKDSITFFKMFTPYMKMAKMDNDTIDISKMDESLEDAKGYYEMILKNQEVEHILRFNIKAFKNNYGLVDLTKMELSYYAVEVGEYEISKLNFTDEFNFSKNSLDVSTVRGTSPNQKSNLVFDVVIAGVER